MKYIATRKAEKIDESKRELLATSTEKLISGSFSRIFQMPKYVRSMKILKYIQQLELRSFISTVLNGTRISSDRENYVDYLANRLV